MRGIDSFLVLFVLAASQRGFTQESWTVPTGTPPYDAHLMSVIENLYRLDESGLYDRSLELFAENATLAIWAEGVNGRHWQERSVAGRSAIRPFLEERCFHRTQDKPNGPNYAIQEATQIGETLTFRLRPDRKSPDGRYYNPFTVKVTFVGGSIQSMTVSEFISWM